MAKVSFGFLSRGQLAARVTANTITVDRIYFVTDIGYDGSKIMSIVRGKAVNDYDILYQDNVATRPMYKANGFQLSYYDGSGAIKIIDLSSMTIGDRSSSGPLTLSYPDGQYMGTLGAAAQSPDYTALPASGVRVNDYYKVVTAGTYNSISCVVGDIIKATATTPAWAKNNTTVLPTGVLQNTDTLQKAFARIVNNMDEMGTLIGGKASQTYVDNTFQKIGEDITLPAGKKITLGQDAASAMEPVTLQQAQSMVVSFLKLQTSPASVAAFNALTGIKVGYSYRITVAGTYAGQVCEVGDVIVAIATTDGTTANTTWLVLQNNIDLSTVFTTAGVGLEEVAGAGGKTIRMPVITQTNNTSNASPAFGATVTMIDSITRDSYGRVTAINTKTVTLPTESAVSGLSANAQAAYKIMTNLVNTGHAFTATYADHISLLMTGWTVDASSKGAILTTDSLAVALHRLENRHVDTEALLDWQLG